MCTLIASITPKGILLMENRDESDSRQHSGFFDDGQIFYPTLGEDENLSWIGMSKDGCVAALLNYEYSQRGVKGYRSRGLLVPQVLRSKNHGRPNPYGFAPFQLFVGLPNQSFVYLWNGADYSRRFVSGNIVLTSSSYSSKKGFDVADGRKGQLEQLVKNVSLDVQGLQVLATMHTPDKELATCMHGEWSRTLCSTIIEATKEDSKFYMLEGQPCEGGEYKLKKEF